MGLGQIAIRVAWRVVQPHLGTHLVHSAQRTQGEGLEIQSASNSGPAGSFLPHPHGHTGSWPILPLATFPPEMAGRPCHRSVSLVTPAIELAPQDPRWGPEDPGKAQPCSNRLALSKQTWVPGERVRAFP